LKVPKLEKEIGIEVYASQSPGIGGCIRQSPEDFVVEEVLVDGSKAKVKPSEAKHPTGIGRYLVCLLVKKGWDTLLTIGEIAKHLGIDRERIQIAGMKDANALTAQHISISRITPENLSKTRIESISLHPLHYSDEKMSSRLLLGNHFQIVVRDIPHAFMTINKRIESVQNELLDLGGLPNFFGHQRFGTIRPITHLVGRFLVKGDFEKAALTFLAESSQYEHPEAREARQQLRDTGDFKEALHSFPRFFKYECIMLSHLAGHQRDFLGAFRRLPLKLLQLFVQAYQSFLFNRFLSQRIERSIPLNTAETGDYTIELDRQGLPTTNSIRITTPNQQSAQKLIDESRMRIAVPLIGFGQNPSDGVQGEIEKEILEAENLTPEAFKISPVPEISARGRLRTILTPVIDPSIEILNEDSANAAKQDLNLGFMLHKGSYATVLLREFMKAQNLIESGF
jgi:tRNA pseudouridine13 synthase